VTFLPWRREALSLFVPRGHPLAARKRVALRSIAAQAMVSISADAAPAFASKVQSLCQASGFRPHIIQEAARAQAVVAMVAAGSGVAILPASVQRLTGSTVRAVPLNDPQALVTYVFAHRTAPAPRELRDFIATMTG
jgi:DNA-binding transcriptional LysR family regulator